MKSLVISVLFSSFLAFLTCVGAVSSSTSSFKLVQVGDSNFEFNLKTRNNDMLTLECDTETGTMCLLTATAIGNTNLVKYKLFLKSKKLRPIRLELQKLINEKIIERYDLLNSLENDPFDNNDQDEIEQVIKSVKKLAPGIHKLIISLIRRGLNYKKYLIDSTIIAPRLVKILPDLPSFYLGLIEKSLLSYYDELQSSIPREVDDYVIQQGDFRYRSATNFDVNLVGKTVEGFPERLRVTLDRMGNLKISVLSAHFSLLDVIEDTNLDGEPSAFRDEFERLFD